MESRSAATWQRPSSLGEPEETVESGDIRFDSEKNFSMPAVVTAQSQQHLHLNPSTKCRVFEAYSQDAFTGKKNLFLDMIHIKMKLSLRVCKAQVVAIR